MALKGPPNFIDRQIFYIEQWVRGLEMKGKINFALVSFLRAIQTSVSPYLFMLDFVKDLILYLILREAVQRLEGSCNGIGCLAASGTELDLLTALLITFCISIILTSINSFVVRKKFFKTNFWLNFVLGFISPLL